MKFSVSTLGWWYLLCVTATTNAFTLTTIRAHLVSRHLKTENDGYGRLVRCNVAASPPKTTPDRSNIDWDEKERKEMNWLVRATGKFLGGDSPELGSMTPRLVREGFDVMKAWSRRSSKPNSQAPHVVERILRRLVDERDAGNDSFFIGTSIYNIVIYAWSISDEDGAAQRAEDILTQMETMYARGDDRVRPDTESYNSVIKAWVKSGRRHYAVAKAEAVIDRMNAMGEKDGKPIRPNRRGYNLLLYALANSIFDDAADRAEEILKKMDDMYAEGNKDIKPDINTYNQVIASIGRCRKRGFEYRAKAIFDKVLSEESDVEPDVATFNHMLGCWLKSDDRRALKHIQEILDIMDEYYSKGNSEAKPDRVTCNTAFTAYARKGDAESLKKAMDRCKNMEQKYNLKPDKFSSNIVIDSLAKSEKRDAPERILEMLTTMEKDFIKGKKQVMPDSYTYSSVIDSFVRCKVPNAALKAEKTLKRMKDFQSEHGGDAPHQSVYNGVINAWTMEKNHKKSIERCQAILNEMENDPNVGSPNRITYNTVLKAFRNGRDEHYAKMAEQLLEKMKEHAKGNPDLRPDCITYTIVINAYGKSNSKHKAEKALAFLQEMLASYKDGDNAVKPNTPAFNAALNACAFCINESREEKEEIFSTMLAITELLDEHGRPDDTSYGTILRGCSNLLHARDKRRDEFTKVFFDKCCQDGKVGQMIMTQLQFAASPELYKSLIGKDNWENVRLQELPASWTCHARSPRYQRYK